MKEQVDELIQLRQELIDTINQFSVEKIQEKLFGDWSLKDMVAHLSGWDVHTLQNIENLKNNKFSQWGEETNEFNRISVEQRKDLSWDEIYLEFVDVSQKLIDQYLSTPEDLFKKQIYPDHDFTLEKSLNIDIDHYQEHLEIIKSKL